jgi:hypothetical protein
MPHRKSAASCVLPVLVPKKIPTAAISRLVLLGLLLVLVLALAVWVRRGDMLIRQANGRTSSVWLVPW